MARKNGHRTDIPVIALNRPDIKLIPDAVMDILSESILRMCREAMKDPEFVKDFEEWKKDQLERKARGEKVLI